MHSTLQFLSLAFTVFPGAIVASNLDVNDSAVQNFTKTTAGAIVKTYKDQLGTPDGVLGLFYSNGSDYYWRETGDVWATLLEYGNLMGDTQFNEVITSGMIHQIGNKILAFMPENQTRVLSNEAQAAWGLAALNAAESNLTMPKHDSDSKDMPSDNWIDLAKNVFDTQVERWSEKLCKGGLNNQIFPLNAGYDILGSDSNGQFLLLAARLARFTGNKTYSEWAEKSYKWAEDVGIVKEYRVHYGLSESKNCSLVYEELERAINHATYTEATAIMSNITNGSDNWKSAVAGFANSSSIFLHDGKFYDMSCSTNGTVKCTDGRVVPLTLGPTILSYARAVKAAPQTAEKLQKILNASAHNFNLSWADIPDDSSRKSIGSFHGIKEISDAYGNLSIALALLEPHSKAPGSNSSDGSPSSNESSGAPSNGASPNTNESSANEQLRASLGLIFGIAASVLLVL